VAAQGEEVAFNRPKGAAISLDQIPINFEPNVGQVPADEKFTAGNADMQLGLGPAGIGLRLNGPEGWSTLRLEFANANRNPGIWASDQENRETNYLIGNDPSDWHTHVPNFGRVTYSAIYPGIDVTFYGHGQHIEYDFVVAPGADPRAIRMLLHGSDAIAIQPDGSVKITVQGRQILFTAPKVYQTVQGGRVERSGRFTLTNKNEIGFRVDAYDELLPLVIDPVLTYSTFLVGIEATPAAVATDNLGDTYIAGVTSLGSYPTTQGAYQQTCLSCTSSSSTVFITKLNASGSELSYSTFLGGSASQQPFGIAVDSNGNAIVVGLTGSTNFPTKNSVPTGSFGNGVGVGFVTSLTADGSSLNYSSLLGGGPHSTSTIVNTVTVDGNGNAFVAGSTDSAALPATSGALDLTPTPGYPNSTVYFAKFGSRGNLVFSGLLGIASGFASQFTGVSGIAIDGSENVFLSGRATPGWPTTSGAYQSQLTGTDIAAPFVTKISADGSTLLYSTYIGESNSGFSGVALAVNSNGNAFIAGEAQGPGSYPTTPNAFQPTMNSSNCCPAFLSEFDPTGSQLVYSTFFGAEPTATGKFTSVTSVALDDNGNIWIAGQTGDPTLPLQSPLQAVFGSARSSGYITEFDPTGTKLLFSTFLGDPSVTTYIAGLAVDPSRKIHVAGTSGPGLYATPGSYLTSVPPVPQGLDYPFAFAAVVDSTGGAPAICISYPQNTGLTFATVPVGSKRSQSITITNCGTQSLSITNVQSSAAVFSVPNASDTCLQPLAASASCTVVITFAPTAAVGYTASLVFTANVPIPVTIPLAGSGSVPVVVIETLWETFPPTFVGQTSPQQAVIIQNGGVAPLSINLSQSSATAGFAIGPSSCTTPVTSKKTCILFLTFSPTVAGVTTGTLSLASNDPVTPLATLALSGYGLSSYPFPELSYLNTPTLPVGAGSTTVSLVGANFFPASVINVNGSPVTTTFVNGFQLSATLNTSLVSNLGELQISVTNPSPGGGLSTSLPLTLYQSVNLAASALTYDSVGQRLWAAIPASATVNPNTVVPINPSTGALGVAIAVAANPTKLAISSDGQYLYVSSNGASEIQRINLGTLAIERTFALPTDEFNNRLVVNDMHVVPGSPQLIVASLSELTGGAYGMALFNDAGLANWITGNLQNNGVELTSFAFAGNAPVIYGLPFSGTGPFFFTVLTLDNAGIHYTKPSGGNNGGQLTASSVASDGTFLYLNNGQVWNPATQSLALTYTSLAINPPGFFASNVIPDDSLGRTFFLDWAYNYNSQFSAIAVHANDQASLAVDGVVTFPQSVVGQIPNSGVQDLALWGSNGFAYLGNFTPGQLQSKSLILFQSSMAAAVPGPQPPFLSGTGVAGVPAGGPAFVLQASGANFVSGSTVNWNGSALSTTFVNSSQLSANVPASLIAVPGFSAITVTNPQPTGGTSGPVLFYAIPVTQATLSPASLSFGPQVENVSSASQAVTLNNTGQGALTIYSISAGGGFTQTNNCGSSLASGASCTINVTFTPNSVGASQATLTVTDNGTTTPTTVALSGTGVLATSSTIVTSSANPAAPGQSVTFTATITSGTSGTITGTVAFLDGTIQLGTGSLSTGKALFSTSTLASGSHSITASYGGDSNFAASTSTALAQVVLKSSATALASSLNPSVGGQSVTFTATVTSTAGGTPTGTVAFLDGTSSLGTGTLNGSGVATSSTPALGPGSHSITVSYGGDANFAASTSSAVNQTVMGFAPVSTAPTVLAGQNIVIPLTLFAASGSNLSFTLSCVGNPSKSSCAFAPNPVTPGPAGTPVQFTFSTVSSRLPARPSNRSPWPWATLGLSAGLAALLAAGMIELRRAHRRRLAFGLCLAIVALGAVLAGCGNSTSSGSTYTGSPKGPSTFTVMGTSGTTTISTQVSVTVQ
jgi:hypothetical protein